MKDPELWARLKDCAFPLESGKTTLRMRLNAMTKLGEERVDRVIDEYRRFLYLAAIAPTAVPSKLVNYVWHMHLADTRAYASFCEEVIGKFIQHAPGRPTQNDDLLYPETLQAYAREFEVDPFWRIWPYRDNPVANWAGAFGALGSAGLILALVILQDVRLLVGVVPIGFALWLNGILSPWSAAVPVVIESSRSGRGNTVMAPGGANDNGCGGDGGGDGGD